MPGRLILLVAVVTIAVVAGVLRVRDAPYIAYLEGHRAEAADGLLDKAQNGDGFAALLVGRSYERSQVGTPDKEAALTWYWTAARLGELRAATSYIGLALAKPQPAEQCRTALSVLEAVGRARDPVAMILLGRYHEKGICTSADPTLAARYYMGAARFDGRFNHLVDAIVTQLDPETGADLRALPEDVDLQPSVALARFLAEIPPPATPAR